jgi:hypothetical protein
LSATRFGATAAVIAGSDPRLWASGASTVLRWNSIFSHMVLELGLGVERLGGRRGDDWRRRRGRRASRQTGENKARDKDAQDLGHGFS